MNVDEPPSPEARRRRDRWLAAGLCGWLVLVVIAMGGLWRYKSRPGQSGETPTKWPRQSHIERVDGLPTLVMFAHPMCVCTRASVSELRELLSSFAGRVSANVLFLSRDDSDERWSMSSLRQSAASIPGVRVLDDFDAIEAGIFGAMTSGHVVLYSAKGDLLFTGGITSARGHVGENAGLLGVASCLSGGAPSQPVHGVFGCPLEEPQVSAR